MTPRRAAVIAMNLPYGSRTWIDAGVDAAWTVTEHHLANVVDLLNVQVWQRGGSKGPQPEPVPRPEQIKELQATRARTVDVALRKRQRMRARTATTSE